MPKQLAQTLGAAAIHQGQGLVMLRGSGVLEILPFGFVELALHDAGDGWRLEKLLDGGFELVEHGSLSWLKNRVMEVTTAIMPNRIEKSSMSSSILLLLAVLAARMIGIAAIGVRHEGGSVSALVPILGA